MSKIYPYAGFWKRFGAFVLDSIILSVPMMLVYGVWFVMSLRPLMPLMAAEASSQAPSPELFSAMVQLYGGMFAFQIISLVVFWLYYSCMESSKYQATLGKMIFGIKVVDNNGKRLTFWHATGRTLGKFISGMTLYIGFLIAGANKHKQALHDIMASAYVVNKAYQEGEPLPEVQTHYVLLGLSIAGIFALFTLPFVLIVLLALSEVNNPQTKNVSAVKHSVQDSMAVSKLLNLQKLPKEQQLPFSEDDYDYTFLNDGTVRAQRSGDATYAFIMKPGTFWPCCQPLVPDGCQSVVNADVCQAK